MMIGFRPPRIAMALAAAAAGLHWLTADLLAFRLTSRLGGVALIAFGLCVMLHAWWLFKAAHVAIGPTARTTRLVTRGAYRVTRNPMYLGLVSMMTGLAVLVGSLPFYAAALAYFIVIDRAFCRYEEAKLAAGFGTEYVAYMSRVRRWL